jgi:hypothetical protein
MASKSFKKLMVVIMMELLILILLKVQANDLARISFPPFSPPIQLHRFSELDKVQINNLAPTTFRPSSVPIMYPHSFELDEVQGTMHTCCWYSFRYGVNLHVPLRFFTLLSNPAKQQNLGTLPGIPLRCLS